MRWLFLLFGLAAALLGSGCDKKAAARSSGGARPEFAIQVIAVDANRQAVSETLSLVGTIVANEMVEIKAETDGTVEEILMAEGKAVKQGELLLRLDESKLAAAVAEAQANYKLSQANFERSKQLLKDNLISQQEADQIAAQFQANQASLDLKKRQLKDCRIVAPFSGIISSRNVSPGQVISKNTTLTWLVDLDPVKVEVNVPERFLSQLQIGQNLELSVATYPDRKFAGQVFFITPFVDPILRTALLKAKIANPKQELKPGMFGNLDLTLQIRQNAVVIPEAALVQLLEGGRARIFTVNETNTAQFQDVKLGVRLAGQVEVVEGLKGGEKVIVEGTQKLGPGAKVKLAPPEAAAAYEGKVGEGGKAGK